MNFLRKATRLTFDDAGAAVQNGETVLSVRANWGHEAWRLTGLLAELAKHNKCFGKLQALILTGHQQTNVQFAEWITTLRGLRELRFPAYINPGRSDNQYEYMSTVIANNAKTLQTLENVDTKQIADPNNLVSRNCVRLPPALFNFINRITAERAYTCHGIDFQPVMCTSFAIDRQHFASPINLQLHNVWETDLNYLLENSTLRNRIDRINFGYYVSEWVSWKEAKSVMEKACDFFKQPKEINAEIEFTADISAWSFAGEIGASGIEAQCQEISLVITDALTFEENRRVPGKTHVHIRFGIDDSPNDATDAVPIMDAATKIVVRKMTEAFPWFSQGRIGTGDHSVRISYSTHGWHPPTVSETLSPPHSDETPSTSNDYDSDNEAGVLHL